MTNGRCLALFYERRLNTIVFLDISHMTQSFHVFWVFYQFIDLHTHIHIYVCKRIYNLATKYIYLSTGMHVDLQYVIVGKRDQC